MRSDTVEELVRRFEHTGVRYLVAGGFAVVAHGYVRYTADLDLLLDLERENLVKALQVLGDLGYRPRAPVPLRDFADPALRESWVREKGLTVFSLFSPSHPETELDVFVQPPLPFEQMWIAAFQQEIAPGLACHFVGFDHLLSMKRAADRPVDRLDIEELQRLREEGTHGDG